MINGKLIKAIITLQVIILSLFFSIKGTRANRAIKLGGGPEAEAGGLGRKWSSRSCRAGLRAERLASDQVNARSGLPAIDTYVRKYYLFQLWINWYFFAKNLAICMLDYEKFAHWRYLDCFLLGRYVLDARVVEEAPYVACYDAAITIFWHYTMIYQTRGLRLPGVEFLLEDKRGHAQYWNQEPCNRERTSGHSLLLEYGDPFNAQPLAARRAHKLRPNRTRAAWDALARVTFIWFACFVILVTLLGILFVAMLLPVGITRAGFALNYRNCFQWVATHSPSIGNQSKSYYNYFKRDLSILNSNEILTRQRNIFGPYNQLVNFNLFHALRFVLEAIETAVILLNIALLLFAGCFLVSILAKDVLYYYDSINARLERLVNALRAAKSLASCLNTNESEVALRSKTREKVERETNEAEISDIQAQIADLFTHIDSYNRYTSIQCLCELFWWLSYSALVSSWIFMPEHDSPKLEWYLIHLGVTCSAFIMLAHMSAVKMSCNRMYALMARAMALDDQHESSKRIWLLLLNYYSPRSMCCFTLLDSLEVTFMSGLKLLAWLVGALVIASSFFQVYNIK